MTVTNEMISAAHKVTMEHGDIVLSYRLLTKIYLSMDALANREKTSGSPSRCSTCGGALPTTNDQDRTGECVCGEPTTTGVIHRTDRPCYHAEPVAWSHNHIDNVIKHRPADIDRHPDRWTPLYSVPQPCPTCEALARTVMMDQTGAA